MSGLSAAEGAASHPPRGAQSTEGSGWGHGPSAAERGAGGAGVGTRDCLSAAEGAAREILWPAEGAASHPPRGAQSTERSGWGHGPSAAERGAGGAGVGTRDCLSAAEGAAREILWPAEGAARAILWPAEG
ncbi:MAG TPA: hypothetical protein PLI95_28275, partial [Polyangiaceae bacterium]|nr:hypothetical protein [Polyangiaceae bacterium]